MYKLLAKTKEVETNLFDLTEENTDIKSGYYYITDAGELVSAAHKYRYVESFIPVLPNTTYYVLGGHSVFLYGGATEASFIEKISIVGSNGSFTTGATAQFMRMYGQFDLPYGQPIDISHYYLVEGSVSPTFAEGFTELDLGIDQPTMNYQANDVAELANRQVSYSRSLALPFTNKNVSFFQYLHTLNSTSIKAYDTCECRLYASDRLIAGKGSLLQLLNVTDTFNVQILAGAKTFLSLLENTSMSALDLGYFQRLNSSFNPAVFDTANGEEFAFATFTKNNIAKTDYSAYSMLPFYKEVTILTKLFAYLGYTWVHNLTDTYASWVQYALPLVDLIPSPDSFDPFEALAINNIPVSLKVVGYSDAYSCNYWNTDIPITVSGKPVIYDTGGLSTYFYDDGDLWANRGFEYTALFDCSLWVHYAQQNADPFIYYPGLRLNVSIITTIDGVDTTVASMSPRPPEYAEWIAHVPVTLKAGDTVRVRVWASNCNVGIGNTRYITNFKASLSFYTFSAEKVPVGGYVYASKNLGYGTMADYFKTVLQKYGLTLYVDNNTNTVYTYTMKKVYDNLVNALDWTHKLHQHTGQELSFAFGSYGQSNNILLKDNTEDALYDRKGTFAIANKTLERTKDLFTIDLKATKNNRILYDSTDPNGAVNPSTNAVNIPLFTYDEDDESYTFRDGGTPQHVKLSTSTVQVRVGGSTTYNWHIATAVAAQDFINNFYSDLVTKMLVNAKVKEDYFYLKPEDLEKFDPTIPIYLGQYGAYFYVNKIVDFTEGKLTKVQLIKL